MKTVPYEVGVRDPKTGIEAVHYVDVPTNLIHKVAWAKEQERDRGMIPLWAKPWLQMEVH